MPEFSSRHRIYRFGVFELDTGTLELRKNGNTEPRLREQALQVLLALMDRPKVVVTREELQQRLWPADTFVDFDHGLNTAINQLRNALGDSAASPRFIQTLPKKGYRFIAPIETADGADEMSEAIVNSGEVFKENKRALNPNDASQQSSPEPMTEMRPAHTLVRSLLSDPSELPSISRNTARLLFSLIQLMYLIFYVVSLARLPRIDAILSESQVHASLILAVLILTASPGIAIRLYLLTASIFDYHELSGKFQKLFGFLFPLDELWALAPFLLVNQIGFGLAIASAAALLYLPFAQRSILLMGLPAERKSF